MPTQRRRLCGCSVTIFQTLRLAPAFSRCAILFTSVGLPIGFLLSNTRVFRQQMTFLSDSATQPSDQSHPGAPTSALRTSSCAGFSYFACAALSVGVKSHDNYQQWRD